jgi:ribosomal protein S27AE
MSMALEEETKAVQPRNHMISSEASHKSTCVRCGGFMVNDSYMDLLNNVGETEFAAKRCVQCGEVVDPVILRNRGTTQEPATAQAAGKMAANHHVTNGRGGFALQTHGTGFRCARGLESQAQQK